MLALARRAIVVCEGIGKKRVAANGSSVEGQGDGRDVRSWLPPTHLIELRERAAYVSFQLQFFIDGLIRLMRWMIW
jgi:hypothetical protein